MPPKVSIVIPTKDRPEDLKEVLKGILVQDYRPLEVIIIDDSRSTATCDVVYNLRNEFDALGIDIFFVKGSEEGLPSARNIGIINAKGEIICFLDDDILFLNKSTIKDVVTFLASNPKVLCVQPIIFQARINRSEQKYKVRIIQHFPFENAIYKVLMLTYRDVDRLSVRRSGMSVFPLKVTKVIKAQRLSGCFFCCKREVFEKVMFDTKLKKWGYMEDLDFSYRVYKTYGGGLHLVPNVKVIHKLSPVSRLPTEKQIQMMIIYWTYVFFKNFFSSSIVNLIFFLWALIGYGAIVLGGLMLKNKFRKEFSKILHLGKAYYMLLKNLKSIVKGDLDFFNKELQ